MVLVVFIELRPTEARFLVGELTIFHRGICIPFVTRISFRQFSFECGLRNARAFEVGFLSRARPYAAVYFGGAFVVCFARGGHRSVVAPDDGEVPRLLAVD